MRVTELFESQNNKRVKHADVVQLIYSIALKYFKAPADVKQDAKLHIKSTDQFWSSMIDDVTRSLQRFISTPTVGVDGFYESVVAAVEDVLQNMREFYSNPNNHEPGYKVPKLGARESVEVPDAEINKVFAAIGGFDDALRSHKTERAEKEAAKKKAASAALTPEFAAEVAALVDKGWSDSFGAATLKKIIKNPKFYDFADGFAPSSEEDVVKELVRTKSSDMTKLGTIAEWSLNSLSNVPPNTWQALRSVKFMKQVAMKSKHLAKYA